MFYVVYLPPTAISKHHYYYLSKDRKQKNIELDFRRQESIPRYLYIIMSEVVGVTEIKEMEAEVKLLKGKLQKVKKAETMSKACSRIVASVNSPETNDSFLSTEGSVPNRFHSSAGSSGESGCCIVS